MDYLHNTGNSNREGFFASLDESKMSEMEPVSARRHESDDLPFEQGESYENVKENELVGLVVHENEPEAEDLLEEEREETREMEEEYVQERQDETPKVRVVSPGAKVPQKAGLDPTNTTTISQNASLSGDIEVEGNLIIYGGIKGDARVSGQIRNNKNLIASKIMAKEVVLGEGSVTTGDIDAEVVVIYGAYKGNIFAKKKMIARSTALILGDVTSESIALEDGASIDGQIHRLGKDKSPTEYFKDLGFVQNKKKDDAPSAEEPKKRGKKPLERTNVAKEEEKKSEEVKEEEGES